MVNVPTLHGVHEDGRQAGEKEQCEGVRDTHKAVAQAS